MKFLFTTLLLSITTLLAAQTVAFNPAKSLMNDNAVASIDGIVYAEAAIIEVSNEFNLEFVAGEYFGDVVISYDLNTNADVRLEVEKAGAQSFSLVDENQATGSQKVLWDENIESGKYTIRLIVDNKVETKTVNLSY